MRFKITGPSWQVIAAAALAGFSSIAAAKGAWLQTSSGQDGDGSDAGLHVEYVLPSSIKVLGDGSREAFLRDVYTPPVHDPFTGADTAFTIEKVMIDCRNMSYGVVAEMAFDKSGTPLSATTGEWDESKPVWSLKNMEVLAPTSVTYRTAKYICKVVR
ncbi:hypothetical protein [Burkholderia ubonensis]|uniref:hypothetical protein n=1 Tax=Burkholderia ubonensis TaxID=101571 RepID=UPI0012FBE187|nr:hypothetical protein [Burkholderia ubonensis]